MADVTYERSDNKDWVTYIFKGHPFVRSMEIFGDSSQLIRITPVMQQYEEMGEVMDTLDAFRYRRREIHTDGFDRHQRMYADEKDFDKALRMKIQLLHSEPDIKPYVRIASYQVAISIQPTAKYLEVLKSIDGLPKQALEDIAQDVSRLRTRSV